MERLRKIYRTIVGIFIVLGIGIIVFLGALSLMLKRPIMDAEIKAVTKAVFFPQEKDDLNFCIEGVCEYRLPPKTSIFLVDGDHKNKKYYTLSSLDEIKEYFREFKKDGWKIDETSPGIINAEYKDVKLIITVNNVIEGIYLIKYQIDS
ncbi:MAG: hypothetical protein N4A47_02175 [Clostridia bacterium]|jgi:hypothetical protein|nr:hypothetical protein [Clostridia bacterium]